MTYEEYIRYHLGGDAGVEERMIATLSAYYKLSRWDSFRLAYYYTTTYHIPSALKLLRNHNTPKSELKFRTDRRYVRIGDNFSRSSSGDRHPGTTAIAARSAPSLRV